MSKNTSGPLPSASTKKSKGSDASGSMKLVSTGRRHKKHTKKQLSSNERVIPSRRLFSRSKYTEVNNKKAILRPQSTFKKPRRRTPFKSPWNVPSPHQSTGNRAEAPPTIPSSPPAPPSATYNITYTDQATHYQNANGLTVTSQDIYSTGPGSVVNAGSNTYYVDSRTVNSYESESWAPGVDEDGDSQMANAGDGPM